MRSNSTLAHVAAVPAKTTQVGPSEMHMRDASSLVTVLPPIQVVQLGEGPSRLVTSL